MSEVEVCEVSCFCSECYTSGFFQDGLVGVFMRKGRLRDLSLDGRTMRDEAPEISPNDAVPCCSGL